MEKMIKMNNCKRNNNNNHLTDMLEMELLATLIKILARKTIPDINNSFITNH
jgi:hypothetical protein